jgi:hypothetical protein
MGHWYKQGGSSLTGSSGGAASAGNVTGLSVSWRHNGDDYDIIVHYTSPGGTFDGTVTYYEDDDQSNLPEAYADGTTTANGTTNAGGEWKPTLAVKKKHVSGEPIAFLYKGPIDDTKTLRIYVNSYNTDDVENPLVRASDASPTPNITVTLDTKALGAAGVEYCDNPTNAACTVSNSFEGGVSVVRVDYTYDGPVGGSGAYVEIPYKDAAGNDQVNVSISVGGKGAAWFPNPKTVQGTVARFRGFVDQFPGVEDDLVNSYVQGITPEVSITIGKSDGTVDLGEGIAATVAASIAVLSKVLGVATNGIDETLIATFAVSEQKLKDASVATRAIVDGNVTTTKYANLSVTNAVVQNLAIDTAKIADASITTVKIVNAAITNALIANLAVGTAHIQDLAVTSAKIASLDVGKLTAGTITVASSSTWAFTVTASGSPVLSKISPAAIRTGNTGDTKYAELSMGVWDLKATDNISLDADFLLATTATAGSRTLPSAPAGFVRYTLNGSYVKVPYYND